MINSFKGEYFFLSNFYPVEILYKKQIFLCVEAAYQASKFTDPKIQSNFLNKSGSDSKKLAKLHNKYIRSDWDTRKVSVMEELLRIKFSNTLLRTRLLDTEGEELVEGNWWGDTFWGVCNGEGENHLGKLLMKIRKDL